MKKTLSILILALLPLAAMAADARATAAQGDEMYRQGNYGEAIALYNEVVEGAGLCSAELYYNLGNAYYREGQMGRAILNYERALRLKPNMGDARDNLALAESRTTDRIAKLPQLFVVRWYDALRTKVTPRTWRVVWLVLLALTGAAVVMFRMGRSAAQRKAGFGTGIAAVVLLAVASLLLIASERRYNAHAEAIVMEQALTVKGSPEQQSVDKLLLHEGTKVVILDSLRGWYKIRIADGTTGWCEENTIERI